MHMKEMICESQIWNQMKNDHRSCDHNFYNCIETSEKNSGLQRGLNPWPRDSGAMLYQLSYEATDIGNWSILGFFLVAIWTKQIRCWPYDFF